MTDLSAHEDKDAIERRDEAIDLILKHGQHPGNEEKAWVIDQVARILLGYEYESAIQQYNQLSDANHIHQAGPWGFGKTPEPLPSSYKHILDKSTLVFNDEEMAKEWLVSALPALNGQRPLDVLYETDGDKKVMSLLRRLQTGDFS